MATAKIPRASTFLVALFITGSSQAQTPPISFAWQDLPLDLPPSITVRAASATTPEGLPIRAWVADIDFNDTALTARPVLSDASSGKEPVSNLAGQHGAWLAVNGGYFDMASRPAKTYSLVRNYSETLRENIGTVVRTNGRYPVRRAAFGVSPTRDFLFDWIAHQKGNILTFAQPLPHTPLVIAPVPDDQPTGDWNAVPDAIGGGPMLLCDGKIAITYNEEAFFGSGFSADKPYPRTAIAATANHHLLLLIADGKQPDWSIGLTLQQCAETLKELGAINAMNLDGGGSTTLYADGQVLNRPSDGRERNVTSILAIVPYG